MIHILSRIVQPYFLQYQLWLCGSEGEIGVRYTHAQISEEMTSQAKQILTTAFRYDWLPHLIRSVPEYAVSHSRHPLPADLGTVPEQGTNVFSLIKRNQTFGLRVLGNGPVSQ